jgi:arginase
MSRVISLIGAPSSAGAYAPGQEKAPAAFRKHGLVSALRQAGCAVADRGDIPGFRWRPDLGCPKAMNLDAVAATSRALADRVADAMAAGEAALVLGGDCTVELGTVAGALREEGSVGLIYIDFDTDLNPPEASDGALDWTGVAHLLGIEGAAPELAGLGPRRPMLAPADVLYLAVENIMPIEAQTIAEFGMPVIGLKEVKSDAAGAAARAAAWAARHERLLIHLDVDVLSYTHCPIAENVRRCDGLTLDELSTLLTPLLAAPNWRALTITEVNPDHAPDEAEVFSRLVAALCGAFSSSRRS